MAGGDKVGHVGVLKPNIFGLTTAVYLPNLSVGRLISSTELVQKKWRVILSESKAVLESEVSGGERSLSATKAVCQLLK